MNVKHIHVATFFPPLQFACAYAIHLLNHDPKLVENLTGPDFFHDASINCKFVLIFTFSYLRHKHHQVCDLW